METGVTTIYQSTQNIHALRAAIAKILRLENDQLRHVAPDVGGVLVGRIASIPNPSLQFTLRAIWVDPSSGLMIVRRVSF